MDITKLSETSSYISDLWHMWLYTKYSFEVVPRHSLLQPLTASPLIAARQDMHVSAEWIKLWLKAPPPHNRFRFGYTVQC